MIQLVNKINVFKLRNKAKESFLSMSFCIEIYNSEFEPGVFGPAQVQALAMIYSGSSSGSDLSSILAMGHQIRTEPAGSGADYILILAPGTIKKGRSQQALAPQAC